MILAVGVGKTNAAVFTQMLIDSFSIDAVVNIGIGGGISRKIKPLDLVIGTTYVHHDVRKGQLDNLFPYQSDFKVDSQLLNIFKTVLSDSFLGTIVSGESFIASNEYKQHLINEFDATLVDMETSAMAHTCWINQVPFLSMRSLSDLAGEEASEEYEVNEDTACQLVGDSLFKVIQQPLFQEGFQKTLGIKIDKVEESYVKETVIREVLEDLPEWFGLDEAREQYVEEGKLLPLFVGVKEEKVVGFLSVKETSPDCIEIFCMGVKRAFRRYGIGGNLLRYVEKFYQNNYQYIQVKTVAKGHYDEYDQTNDFYEKHGFTDVEVFPTLWDEWNPCLLKIKTL